VSRTHSRTHSNRPRSCAPLGSSATRSYGVNRHLADEWLVVLHTVVSISIQAREGDLSDRELPMALAGRDGPGTAAAAAAAADGENKQPNKERREATVPPLPLSPFF